MKFIVNFSLAALLVIPLSGCIIIDRDHNNWRSLERENRELISELELNTERSKVLMRLGTPNFSEAFTFSGDEYRILYYRTQRYHSDGETSKDETTPLVFKNDRLIGWGEETLDSVRI